MNEKKPPTYISWKQYFRDEYSTLTPDEWKKYSAGGVARELQLVSTLPRVALDLGRIDTSALKFDSSWDSMQKISEIVLAIVSREAIPIEHRMHYFFRELKRIGESSAFGLVLAPNRGDFVVMKSSQSADDNDNTVHEAAVGILALNALRTEIPNFMYIFGLFACGVAHIDDKTRKVVDWCEPGPNTRRYLVMENLSGTQSLGSFAETANYIRVFKVLIQLLLALQRAFEYCAFTHYDAHLGNVVIKTCSPTTVIYRLKHGNVTVGTSEVPIVIDYGRAFFRIGAVNYGAPDPEGFGYAMAYSSLRPNILGDAYRVINFLGRANREFAIFAEYFGNIDPKIWNDRYASPPLFGESQGLYELINFCLKRAPAGFSLKDEFPSAPESLDPFQALIANDASKVVCPRVMTAEQEYASKQLGVCQDGAAQTKGLAT